MSHRWISPILGVSMLMGIQLAHAMDYLAQAVSAIDANVVFMRHENAPGFGDPENFALHDCSTQRNLDEKGRKQAQKMGDQLRASSVKFVEILTSEWCRCKETTDLLNVGSWQTFSGLNSFFQGYADENATLKQLRQKLSSIKPGVTLMVTHQVVISAVTGRGAQTGEMIAFNTRTNASVRVERR